MKRTAHIPEGYNSVIASLSVKDAERAVEWYKNIFEAEERARFNGPDQKIMHSELVIGDTVVFLAEENPQYGAESPQATQGNSIKLHMYVEDVDGLIKKAVQNGASIKMATMDMFYGDRVGCIDDPFGYSWVLATHVKDVSKEEMKEKAETFEHA